MRQIRSLLILAAVVVASAGCKTYKATQRAEQIDARTSEASQSEPAAGGDAASASDADKRPLIVCFGDSLTAGYGTEPGQSYPDYLQADLDSQGYKYRVVNEGVSGNTTKDGINRLPGILAMKAAVVLVEFGGNDGLRGLPIEDSRTNLDTMVSKLTASGSKVVLLGITLPRNYGATYIQQFDATYPLIAKKYSVPLLPFLLNHVYGLPGMMQADETHATAAGNKIVADNVLPLITPLLKK